MNTETRLVRSDPLQWVRFTLLAINCVFLLRSFFSGVTPSAHMSMMVVLLFAYMAFAFVCVWRLKGAPISDAELFLQLAVDSLHVQLMCAFNGVSGQAFSSLALVFVVISAMRLSRGSSVVFALLSALFNATSTAALDALGAYAMPSMPMTHGSGEMRAHLWGMVTTFGFAALLITGACLTLRRTLMSREKVIAQLREKHMRDEHLLALGTQSVTLTHELATPLNSLVLLVGELQQQVKGQAAEATVQQMDSIVDQCNKQLRHSLNQRMYGDPQQRQVVTLLAYLQGLLKDWAVSRPMVEVVQDASIAQSDVKVSLPVGLQPVLLNLLNNAADASQSSGVHRVELAVERTEDEVVFRISDFGGGVDSELQGKLGVSLNSNKAQGHGLGLAISHAALERWQGRLSLINTPSGAEAVVHLPINTPEGDGCE